TSNHDNLTNVKTPKFNVTVNQSGTVTLDYKGDGSLTSVQTVPAAGQYTFTAPQLSDGTYNATATFVPDNGGASAQDHVTITIDARAPTLLAGSLSAQGPLYTRSLVFSKPLDAATISAAALLVSGPGITGSVH